MKKLTAYSFGEDYYELPPGQQVHLAVHLAPVTGNPSGIVQVICRWTR